MQYTHTNPTLYAPHGHVKPRVNNNKEIVLFYTAIYAALVMQERSYEDYVS